MKDMDGFIIVDKPKGMTSHDVVNFVRRKFKMRRVGHAGTLDPLATGVLVILLGRSTQLFDKFSSFDKAYEATMTLGITTDSADIEGKVLKKSPYDGITEKQVDDVFKQFIGEIQQTPPMVSAVKVNGKRLYKLARQGIEVKREPRKINIKSLGLINFALPEVQFSLECSKGTYVRQLAEDVSRLLGCGGCISQIKRTRIGNFVIEEAVKLEDIDESYIRHWQE